MDEAEVYRIKVERRPTCARPDRGGKAEGIECAAGRPPAPATGAGGLFGLQDFQDIGGFHIGERLADVTLV